MNPLKIGMIGLDTSHCLEFTKLLNDPEHPFHVEGGRIVAAYPFYSEDLEISRSRVQGYTETLKNDFNVKITDSIKETAQASDAILLTAVDGRKHLELFKELLPYKLPVFIDKPLALSSDEAEELFLLAAEHDVPVMSSSSLRFAESFIQVLGKHADDITGIYVHGPLPMQEQMPGYFWYGIHMVEMVVAAMGTGVENVTVKSHKEQETVLIEWKDGRHALLRGEYEWHSRFGATLHTNSGFYNADIANDQTPFYASLLEQILVFFITRNSQVPKEQTLEVIMLIEMINKARSRVSKD
jgi:predicted dehydrogenase